MAGPERTIGHYRIGEKLGQGGMGEVWRASDPRLNREVAIKVLPPAMAADPVRMGRFAREAQVLASLNHPGIAAIYGVEERALVMELVEGATLAERIGSRGMSLEDALPLARQMAEALGYAHERGVVHRDLKPANVKITPEGTVKILDFGLAKAMSTETSASGAAEAVTVSTAATLAGTILGTAAYMAPEQARGQNVDRRADVWAFGVVLYEMLTGERPFGGPTVSDTLAAVLTATPNLERAPVGARRLLRACLEKDPKRRLRDIGDGLLLVETGEAPVAARTSALPWALLGIAVIVVAVLGDYLWLRRGAPAPAALEEFTIPPPGQTQFSSGGSADFTLSPGGKRLIFGAVGPDGTRYLWLRRLGSTTPQRLDGTAGGLSPFWSPDGQAIIFFQNGELMRMDLAGGPPVALASAPNDEDASWGSRGVIVYAPTVGGLLQIPAGGGSPTPATEPGAGAADSFPWFLPDGQHFLFSRSDGTIRLGTLGSLATRVLVAHAGLYPYPEYASGYLLFQQGTAVMAQPFDAKRLALSGSLAPITGVAATTYGFEVSGNGVLVFAPPAAAAQASLNWYDPAGKLLSTVGSGQMWFVKLAPDGRRALVNMDGDLWIFDFGQGTRRQFTFDGQSSTGVWSPDGREIVFQSNRGGHNALYIEPADGSAPAKMLYDQGIAPMGWLPVGPTGWSPDGKLVLYFAYGNTGGIYALPADGSAKPFRVFQPPPGQASGTQVYGSFSPDGRWLVYELSGDVQNVYLTPYPGPGGTYRVSVSPAGGGQPRWSADGTRIYFISGAELMEATVRTQGLAAEIGAPQPLFGPLPDVHGQSYDVAPGGKRVLAIMGGSASSVSALTLIQNWPLAWKPLQH